jgi:DNA-binding response OmpR family regulator
MSGHIYVIDDDPALLKLSELILKTEGFEVEPFGSSLQALDYISDSAIPNPDAIVLDLNMPDLDGREFYRRAREAGYSAPVLILSAYGAAEAQRELGAEAALAKPFMPEDLAQKLKELLP